MPVLYSVFMSVLHSTDLFRGFITILYFLKYGSWHSNNECHRYCYLSIRFISDCSSILLFWSYSFGIERKFDNSLLLCGMCDSISHGCAWHKIFCAAYAPVLYMDDFHGAGTYLNCYVSNIGYAFKKIFSSLWIVTWDSIYVWYVFFSSVNGLYVSWTYWLLILSYERIMILSRIVWWWWWWC